MSSALALPQDLGLPKRHARPGDKLANVLPFRQANPEGLQYRESDAASDPQKGRYIGYAYAALRGDIEQPVLDSNNGLSILGGIYYICEGLHGHHRNVQKISGAAASHFGLNGITPELGAAAAGHDITKPKYPWVFNSGKKYDTMTEEEQRAVQLHPYESAWVVEMCGHPDAARIIVTAASLSRRHAEQYRDLRGVKLFAQGTGGHIAAQILETADQAAGMREMGPHRPYKLRLLGINEIHNRLRRQVVADPEIISYVVKLLRESVSGKNELNLSYV